MGQRAPDIVEEDLVIPEWGGKKLRLRGLTKTQQVKLLLHAATEAKRVAGGKDPNDDQIQIQIERMLLMSCVFRPSFTDADVSALVMKRGAAVERILARIYEMTNLRQVVSNLAAEVNGVIASAATARTGRARGRRKRNGR